MPFLFYIPIFLFSILFSLFAHTEYTPHVTMHWHNQESNKKEYKHHHDSFDDIGNKGRIGVSYNQSHFNRYTCQNFRDYFTGRGYTQEEILNQRRLYMFDEFVKFIQTYPNYEDAIRQIHVELKNLGRLQKAYYIAKGTYCKGLQRRIKSLYNQLNLVKTRDFFQQKYEYEALQLTYQAHMPLLFKALENRLNIYNAVTNDNHELEYTSRAYSLSSKTKQLLHKYRYDSAQFTECSTHQLGHVIHQESLELFERIACLPHNSVLYDHQEVLVDFTVAMVDYNHAGLTDKAMNIGDLCWTFLDYGQAIAEGVALGAYTAVHDVLTNPIEATVSIVAGKQILAYQLCKVLYNVADIGITAITNLDQAKEKWNKYAEPLNNLIDEINKKEITVRDAIKGGTAFVVGYKAQGKLLSGLGKFCNTIKAKSINFVKNNRLANPVGYLTAPEGLLFKAAIQSNKFQQAEQSAVSQLNNTLEKITGTVWENIKPTDSVYLGTKIPKSFELTIGKQKFWVAPNATKHMLEYIQDTNGTYKKIITHNMPVNCQVLLSSLQAAVRQAIYQGIKYDTMIRIGCWELRLGLPRQEGLLPSIYHANFKPKNW